METQRLSKKELKNYLFEFIAKKGDGENDHITNFYGHVGWLIKKLKIPQYREEATPGGLKIDVRREFVEMYRQMSWDVAQELENAGYIKRDRSQREEGFYKLTEKGEKQWQEHKGLGPDATDRTYISDFWDIIHEDIIKVSRSKFEDGHYADSVESAFKETNARVKKIVIGKTGKELDGASLMTTAFSVNKPIISLDDLSSKSGQDIQQGYMQIFAGAMTGIRNPKAHDNITISKERAIHFIFLASLLMCKLDEATF